MTKKIMAWPLFFFIIFQIILTMVPSGEKDTLLPRVGTDTDLSAPGSMETKQMMIKEFTWSVTRYDHQWNATPFGPVEMPKPSPGAIMIPANMMMEDTCTSSLSVYREDDMETLQALATFNLDHIVVGLPYIRWRMIMNMISVFTGIIMPCLHQKNSAAEIYELGEDVFWADAVGDCYSQSMFNTAVLRLCGFPAEDVFCLLMPMHAVTVVCCDDQWYVFDNVNAQMSKSNKVLLDSYHPPLNMIYSLENDKYYINFGMPDPSTWPYQVSPYSNMDPTLLHDIVNELVLLFNNASLGAPGWEIEEFINQAIASPDMSTVAIPFTVQDAVGDSLHDKAISLVDQIHAFIDKQGNHEQPTQYDRSLYVTGTLEIEYPQVYADATKYGEWTRFFATRLDQPSSSEDIQNTIRWINRVISTDQESIGSTTHFSDFIYLKKKGSTIDKALVAYGTLRNMIKNHDPWQPDDVFILVTNEWEGILAVNSTDGWKYLTFNEESQIENDPPDNLKMAFNEYECLFTWDK